MANLASTSAVDGASILGRHRLNSFRSDSEWGSTAAHWPTPAAWSVDSAAVQDGFDLYLHGFIVTDDGKWVVVQQGMNGDRKQARRYHWLSEGLNSFVDAPHAAIDGVQQGAIINLTDRRAEPSRRTQLELLSSLGPDGIVRELSVVG